MAEAETGSPVADAVGALALVDHHVHPVLGTALSQAGFEELITESDRAPAPSTSRFDSQLGVAIRRWCAPVLGLPASAPALDYLNRRAELGPGETARRLLAASGVAHYLVDTGYLRDGMLGLPEFARLTGVSVDEVVRLEAVAERAVVAGQASAADYAARLADELWQRTAHARGVKSIIGYRFGLDFDPEPPTAAQVSAAAGRWLRQIEAAPGQAVRLTDQVLLRHALWTGVERGLPVQIHTGFGDPDADLRRCDPLLLREFAEHTQPTAVPIMLLHCYPYHRQAGHLAATYPHVYADVGLAVPHVGARAAAVVAESLELAPFTKVLFSSDAFALPELHYLGALLWRRAAGTVFSEWVAAGEWAIADAIRAVELIGFQNAHRVYRLQ